jgi:Glycosyl hydrolases family 39
MRLNHGLNATVNWRAFALSPFRERLWTRFRQLETRVVRILVFDPRGPDPLMAWEEFEAFVQAVLHCGAVPMVTFSKFRPPYSDPAAVGAFAAKCDDVVRHCINRWGGEAVRAWYWCVWNQPNSEWVSAGMTFEDYRRIYEAVATQLLSRLAPYLSGARPLIGGPAVDGFQPFWMDWMWRFVEEIDNTLVGFISWHRFGDWREPGAWGSPSKEALFRSSLLARTAEYRSRAWTVGRLLGERGVQNVCGEWNAHSHHDPRVSRSFNQTAFGVAYYASALLQLVRGGADLEVFWSGTGDAGPYGLVDAAANPTPVFYARQLLARHLRHGDRLSFPFQADHQDVDVVVVEGVKEKRSIVVVHQSAAPAVYCLTDWPISLEGYLSRLTLDHERDPAGVTAPFDGCVSFRGYGVAVVTNTELSEAAARDSR